MHPYDEVYVAEQARKQGQIFFYVREEFIGIDEKWFITAFMNSKIRALLDDGNPKYLNMPAPEMLDKFINIEYNGNYKRGEEWGGFLPEWVGRIYALYQWQYNIPSKDLIEKLTLDDMERIYPALHQMGWDAAINKIHEVVMKNTYSAQHL